MEWISFGCGFFAAIVTVLMWWPFYKIDLEARFRKEGARDVAIPLRCRGLHVHYFPNLRCAIVAPEEAYAETCQKLGDSGHCVSR